jgi:transcriptional regulator with XRE-family HTH domain
VLRSAMGMSQEILAGQANISRINLSRIENGKAEPGLRTIEAIAKGLGMSITELMSKVD